VGAATSGSGGVLPMVHEDRFDVRMAGEDAE
jgi:hypothetical protein